MKTYKLSELDVADEQKTVTIAEEVTETREKKTSIAQLKEEHARVLEQITSLETRADEIVDLIEEIDTELNLEITDKPTRLVAKKK